MRLLAAALNLLASIHFVWFYLSRVPSAINLVAYEHGAERTPFQYRMLMMLPMRWAHASASVGKLAAKLSSMPGWFPGGVHPEGIAEAAIDLLAIVTAGLLARSLYRKASPTGLLTPFIYPLTLVMATTTYCLLTNHALRFVYDLPSLAFFSLSLFLLYSRNHPVLFAALFTVATMNRETTLFLLLLYAMAQCMDGNSFRWKRLFAPPTLGMLLGLSGFWMAWHHFVVARYAANPAASVSRLSLNLGLLLFPVGWPQMLGVFGYVLPLVLLFRRQIPDPLLRAWLWVLPAWIVFMFYFGLLLEIRIFGELIPFVACVAALLCEETLLTHLGLPRVRDPASHELDREHNRHASHA